MSVGFSKQEYWSGLPYPPLGNLPDLGIEPTSLTSPALVDRFFTTTTKPLDWIISKWKIVSCPHLKLFGDVSLPFSVGSFLVWSSATSQFYMLVFPLRLRAQISLTVFQALSLLPQRSCTWLSLFCNIVSFPFHSGNSHFSSQSQLHHHLFRKVAPESSLWPVGAPSMVLGHFLLTLLPKKQSCWMAWHSVFPFDMCFRYFLG